MTPFTRSGNDITSTITDAGKTYTVSMNDGTGSTTITPIGNIITIDVSSYITGDVITVTITPDDGTSSVIETYTV